MAEYIVQGESLTAIADEIRELSGTTNAMGLDAMAGNVSEANEEVSNQVDLIAQIASALKGKAGGSGSVSYDTCTVNIGVNYGVIISGVAFVTSNDSGNIEAKLNTDSSTSFNLTCLCGSLVVVCFQGSISSYNTKKATNLGWIGNGYIRAFYITAAKNETATITALSSGGTAD